MTANRLLVLATALLLAGCEESAVAPPRTVPVEGGQQAEQAIGPEGGNLVLTTSEGASFALEVPAGALDSSTVLRLETAAVGGRSRFHLRLLPAGLVMADGKEVSLRITLPEAMSLPTEALLAYDGTPVPFTREANGELRVRLSLFAEAVAATRAATQYNAAAAVTASAATPACGGVPSIGNFEVGGLTDVELNSAADYGRCVLGAVQALASSGRFSDAMNLANATAAYLQSVGTGDPGGFIAQADAISCTAYRGALNVAKATTVTSLGQLHALIRVVLYWEVMIQQRGNTCTQVEVNEYLTVLEEKVAQATAAYAQLSGTLTDVSSPQYAAAVTEVREQETTLRELQSLRPTTTLFNATRFAIEEVAQPVLVTAMLDAPWQRCRSSGQYDRLIELMRLTDGAGIVRRAARNCGVQLMARSLDAPGSTETSRLSAPLGGVGPAEERSVGTLSVQANGKLRILGPILALQCPSGVTGTTEGIEIRINGQLVTTLSGAVVADPEITLEMPALLQTAGIDAANFSDATLTVVRTGNACGGFWGAMPQTLASITLVATTGTVITRFEGGGSTGTFCFASTTWDSGMKVWLTRLADGTHRIVGSSPSVESVSGEAAYVVIADRNDPEIENTSYQFTPISVSAAGGVTQYSANWNSGDGGRFSNALLLIVNADGTATMTYTMSGETACQDGGAVTRETARYTFSGARVP